jgi:hypothetical protein
MTLLILSLLTACIGAMLTFWRPPLIPRHSFLLVLAAAPQISSMLGLRSPWLLGISAVLVAVWCVVNRRVAGVLCITLGAAMNLLVMALHGGAMPVHVSTLATLGQHVAPGTVLAASKDLVIEWSLLGWLADWIVIRVGPKAIIASPGDLVVLGGLLYWLLVSPSQRKDRVHASNYSWLSFRSRHAWSPHTD